MDLRKEWKRAVLMVAVFAFLFFLPVERPRFVRAIVEALRLAREYARLHVVFCLVPAMFIAGAISVLLSHASVMRYLGAQAHKGIAYSLASVSGSILAVCSCTVLPLFAGIYRMGAGLGPAIAFLYSGPAVNVLAIVLTMRVLGVKLGIARTVAAVGFSVVIGLLMHVLFRSEEMAKAAAQAGTQAPAPKRPMWQNAVYLAVMMGILVFANWQSHSEKTGLVYEIFVAKYAITGLLAMVLAALLVFWFRVEWWKMLTAAIPAALLALLFPTYPSVAFTSGVLGLSAVAWGEGGELGEWLESSWGFAKQIMPLLLGGVLVAGFLLGRPGKEGLIPSRWVHRALGGNSLRANLFASVAGALMYFATLTEVPIVQGLIGSGMGQGPALALLLAGPALSLPNMLVLRSVMGTKKTAVFVVLVVCMATFAGFVFGVWFAGESG